MGIRVDLLRSTISWQGGAIKVSRSLAVIMHSIVEGRGRKKDIIEALYGWDERGGPEDPRNIIAVHVSKLRAAFADARCPFTIETIWGVGYTLVVDAGGKQS
jgi:DNA-binding response OmpR family regulator